MKKTNLLFPIVFLCCLNSTSQITDLHWSQVSQDKDAIARYNASRFSEWDEINKDYKAQFILEQSDGFYIAAENKITYFDSSSTIVTELAFINLDKVIYVNNQLYVFHHEDSNSENPLSHYSIYNESLQELEKHRLRLTTSKIIFSENGKFFCQIELKADKSIEFEIYNLDFEKKSSGTSRLAEGLLESDINFLLSDEGSLYSISKKYIGDRDINFNPHFDKGFKRSFLGLNIQNLSQQGKSPLWVSFKKISLNVFVADYNARFTSDGALQLTGKFIDSEKKQTGMFSAIAGVEKNEVVSFGFNSFNAYKWFQKETRNEKLYFSNCLSFEVHTDRLIYLPDNSVIGTIEFSTKRNMQSQDISDLPIDWSDKNYQFANEKTLVFKLSANGELEWVTDIEKYTGSKNLELNARFLYIDDSKIKLLLNSEKIMLYDKSSAIEQFSLSLAGEIETSRIVIEKVVATGIAAPNRFIHNDTHLLLQVFDYSLGYTRAQLKYTLVPIASF